MSEEKPFIKNSVWQEQLESVAQNAKPAETDYKKLFEETDNFGVDVKTIMGDIGVQPDSGTDNTETSKSESMDTIGAYIAHAQRIEDIISVTHNPPTSPLRRTVKRTLLKVLCWPTRRYLIPQVNFNTDIVRANQEMLVLLAKINKSDRDSAEEAKKELLKANQKIDKLYEKIEELEEKIAFMEKSSSSEQKTSDKTEEKA